ncbi:hypothetical protein GCM10025867_11470 [Frondihabitans sucicola]|uniref:Uncharacterized protein n=1 Tax=Frondihabitans sucicola TaxID=1268041 RepID=A0ABM8GKI3_9MICO|nr:hypothetical protein [Frondihabitans sucicola]BDZ48906.1 hypothetical protein GCM10025867_11470 [Frondihabitans sucicola]
MVSRTALVAAVVVLTTIAGSSGVATTGLSRAGVEPRPAPASTETIPGLDVSAYQHGVDWRKAYAKEPASRTSKPPRVIATPAPASASSTPGPREPV